MPKFKTFASWLLMLMGSFLATNFVVVLVFIRLGMVGSPPPGIAISEGASLYAFMVSIPIWALVVILAVVFRLLLTLVRKRA